MRFGFLKKPEICVSMYGEFSYSYDVRITKHVCFNMYEYYEFKELMYIKQFKDIIIKVQL